MKYINFGDMEFPQIALGCMRISALSLYEIKELFDTCMSLGINFFDHADIYGGGKCEEMFARSIEMKPSIREKIILQSKCGIRAGYYDFSEEHILNSVDGILKRLQTDYLDILLLHRPDTLMEPEEVAEAFNKLHSCGKVRKFGVSNHNSSQIRLLKKYVKQDIFANQLQISMTNTGMIDSGLNVNMKNDASVLHDDGILEYCRTENILIQAWSPLQYGFFNGVFSGSDAYPELNAKLEEYASKNNITPAAAAITWLMRHPARIQPIVGTTKKERIIEICKACEPSMLKEEWYALYRAAGNGIP